MHKPHMILVVSVIDSQGLLLDELQYFEVFQEQPGSSNVATSIVPGVIANEMERFHVTCDVRLLSPGEGYVVLKLEHPGIVEHRIHLVNKSVLKAVEG